VQAANDARLQLGRSGSNAAGLVCMLPSVVLICLTVYGMLAAWWGGIIVMVAVNLLLAVVLTTWQLSTHLEAVKDAAVLSRSIKLVLKFLLLSGALALFVCMVHPSVVSEASACPWGPAPEAGAHVNRWHTDTALATFVAARPHPPPAMCCPLPLLSPSLRPPKSTSSASPFV
jgi:hypothetical protein